ncbi:FIST signal transduction protein [Kineococcus gynurae]|uniref:FIST signal transduction protein n=1 Tax=Kineococcus gynurae TaxID=452979 RepID=A0ABV5LWK2_9ACTN
MGTGRVEQADDLAGPVLAARVATAVAEALAGRTAALVLAHVDHRLDLPLVTAALQAAAGAAPVLGATTGTVYSGTDEQPAVVLVTALGGDDLQVGAAVDARPDPTERATVVAERAALGVDSPHRLMIMLPNGTAGDQQAMVLGAYDVLGPAVSIVGGGADGDLETNRSWQFLGTTIVENGLAAAVLGTDRPVGVAAAHGYSRLGRGMVVTDSDGQLLRELDGRPALDAYLDNLADAGIDVGDRDDEAALTRLAFAHPLGLARRRRDEARTIVSLDLAARTMTFVSTVEAGGLVHPLQGDEQDMLAGAAQACDQAVRALGADPVGMVLFSCIARRALLTEEGRLAELDAARDAGCRGEVTLVHSCGEIARVSGSAGCHNQTVVALAF